MLRILPSVCHVMLVVGAVLSLSACSGERTAAPQREENPPVAAPPAAGDSMVVGMAPAAIGGLSAVVILQPREPSTFPAQTFTPVMDQISLTFTPTVLFARTGQPTEFRNSDEVLHNVRVRNDETKEPAFNVAIPTGGTYRHTFPSDGFYDVGCDIHPGMAAVVVASTTPYAVLAAGDGAFAIPDVPPGPYTLTVYADVRKIERSVEVVPGRTDLAAIDP